jgi:hypothetical protein
MNTLGIDILEAWCEAAPLRTEVGFARRSAQIDAALLQAIPSAANEARASVFGWPRDQITFACHRAWNWTPGTESIPLGQHLGRLANRYLERRGDQLGLRSPNLSSAWRAISLFLPQDLLIAAHAASTNVDASHDRVDCTTPSLNALLDQGIAETHLHIGAAFCFSDLWSGLLVELAHPECDLDKLATVKDERYLARLLSAALVRPLLGAYLHHVDSAQQPMGFAEFFDQRTERVDVRLRSTNSMESVAACCRLARSILCEGADLQNAPGFSCVRLAGALGVLMGKRGERERPNSLAVLRARDSLMPWFAAVEGGSSSEMQFVTRAIRHVWWTENSLCQDSEFSTCFWQYVRVRCQVFACLVESPGPPGLGWFVEHYERIGPHRRGCDGFMMQSALRLAGGQRLRSLECRTAPADSWDGIRNSITEITRDAAAYGGEPRPEIGVVLHFIKRRSMDGLPVANPSGAYAHGRYARWYQDALGRAESIAWAIEAHPELAWVLRGIDVASEEQAIPTWPLLGIYARVREAFAELQRRHPSLPPLRATAHVGEDFARLVTGVRCIDEALHFGLLQHGDRMGHALALAWDPHTWRQGNPKVLQTREDRLDDLLWEHTCYSRGVAPVASRVAALSSWIEELGLAIYGRNLSVDVLVQARDLRHRPQLLRFRFGYPQGRIANLDDDTPLGCLGRYLFEPQVYKRGIEPIQVEASEEECEFIAKAQRRLAEEVSRQAITVESNPSSNLVIGNFGQLSAHPTFRLRPLGSLAGEMPNISINSDDPITFASGLVDEFAFVHGALTSQGCAEETALAWIDTARKAGLSSRFTLPQSKSLAVLGSIVSGNSER